MRMQGAGGTPDGCQIFSALLACRLLGERESRWRLHRMVTHDRRSKRTQFYQIAHSTWFVWATIVSSCSKWSRKSASDQSVGRTAASLEQQPRTDIR